MRQAEQAEVYALQERERLDDLQAHLVPNREPGRPVAWGKALNDTAYRPPAYDVCGAGLSTTRSTAAAGVSAEDWERVLQARRDETGIEHLRRLGPELQLGEVVALTSDVGVRRPEKRHWLEIRTACVRTTTGYQYLSGNGQALLQKLYLLLLLGGGLSTKLTLLGDGARWIATFFKTQPATWPGSELIVDWYHLNNKKCYQLTSLIARGRGAKKALLGQLLYRLWRGQLDNALALLEAYRPQAKDTDPLETMIKYLSDRREYLPNYKRTSSPRV
jgi:hypothetical protein